MYLAPSVPNACHSAIVAYPQNQHLFQLQSNHWRWQRCHPAAPPLREAAPPNFISTRIVTTPMMVLKPPVRRYAIQHFLRLLYSHMLLEHEACYQAQRRSSASRKLQAWEHATSAWRASRFWVQGWPPRFVRRSRCANDGRRQSSTLPLPPRPLSLSS